MTLPEGPDGRELADILQKESPDLKVILTSGYHAGREVADGPRFLLKPCPIPELLGAVGEALSSRATDHGVAPPKKTAPRKTRGCSKSIELMAA